MSTDDIVLTAHGTQTFAEQVTSGQRRQPIFWLALACAALVHAALIVGVGRSSPRHLGEPGGSTRTINVELVDEADLRSRSAGANPQQGSSDGDQAAPSAPQVPVPLSAAALPALEAGKKQAPEQPTPPGTEPSRKGERDKKNEPFKKTELTPPSDQLDLSVPLSLTLSGAQGGSSSATRPPGITRSGENDRFGRGVIRALQKTMPPLDDVKGRVTVRIILNGEGNIAKVQLVNSAGNADLDQSVIFSAHQASFPFPPKGATLADRTFLVTYIYR